MLCAFVLRGRVWGDAELYCHCVRAADDGGGVWGDVDGVVGGGIVGPQIVAFIKDRWPGGAVAASAAQAGAKVAQVAGGAAAGVNTGAAAAGAGPGVRVAAGAANVAAAGPAAMTAASWIFLIGAALLALGFGLSFLLSDGENLRKGV